MPDFSIDPRTCLGPVHLAVSDLERVVRFYTRTLGLRLLERREESARLGAADGTSLLVLEGNPEARPKPPRTTGLYHVAILLPSRLELARVLRHLVESRCPPQGAADHLVSEALYLSDPEGNGLEIYADRPREAWPRRHGQIQMATNSLDVENLLAELSGDDRPWSGMPRNTRVGHIHLQVADLRSAEAFYRDVLGFDLVQRYGPSAIFLSAGGYHHHLGLNTWASAGAPPPPPDATGLHHYTICLPGPAELDRLVEHIIGSGVTLAERPEGLFLRDPSGIGVVLASGCGIV